VVLPFLRELGDRWEAGTLSVAHEHFVSDMLRRKLSALSSVPPHQVLEDASAPSPVVLLACPPGERHDLVLLCVALMLRERGVRARFLGADTPIPAVLSAARAASADAVVLAATRSTAFTAHGSSLLRLAEDRALYLAGRGADERTVAEVGATALPEDPVRAVVFLVGALNEVSGSW
jgi:methanogenic corrinoid protein MtbC1